MHFLLFVLAQAFLPVQTEIQMLLVRACETPVSLLRYDCIFGHSTGIIPLTTQVVFIFPSLVKHRPTSILL